MFKCGHTESTTVEQEVARNNSRTTQEDSLWFTVTTLGHQIIGEAGLLRMWPAWRCTDLSIILPDPRMQRSGYGMETVNMLMQLAFNEYNMNRIAIGVVSENHPALRFYERVGFQVEGRQE